MRNRTADLLLTMETLCLLSYRGAQMPRDGGTNGPRYTLRRGQGESRPLVTSTAAAPIDIVRS